MLNKRFPYLTKSYYQLITGGFATGGLGFAGIVREPGQPIKGSGTCASLLETPEAPIRDRAKSWDKVNISSPVLLSFPSRNISLTNANWKNPYTSSGRGALLHLMVLTDPSAPAPSEKRMSVHSRSANTSMLFQIRSRLFQAGEP